MAHRHDIQGLRGVAVLLVVFAHAGVRHLQGGYIGVDVFFVLSGYLITGLLLVKGVSLRDFYARRARRILPAAALTLVATDIAANHLLNFVRARDAVSDSIWAALFGANVHFAQQGSDYFNQGQPPSPFLHFWTLSVEEQFYLVWPSLLALVLLVTAARRPLLLMVGTIGAASLAWSIYDTAASPVTAYFSTFTRAWELALGAALAIWTPRARTACAWLGLAAIGCAAVLFSSGTLLPGTAAIVVSLVALVSLRTLGETATRIDSASAAVGPAALVNDAPRRAKPLAAVVSAVRAAERGVPLPSPLTPPVDSLRGDFYSFPDGCNATGRMITRICRLGDTSSPKSIALFGDSHAQMWMPAILQMAFRDHWLVLPFVKLSCVPRTWVRPGECRDWYRWARHRAAELHPDVTLIIGSWAGTREPRLAIRPVAQLSAAMQRSSASVIVVGDPISQRRDPVDCLLASGATMKTCTSRQQPSQARADRTIASNAHRTGVGFVDARGWLCARARTWGQGYLCPLVINRTITFLDDGHISKTYALELAPPFRTAFRHALFG